MSDATHFLHSERPFTFECGRTLDGITQAYEVWGELNAARDNAVMVLTGLSPSAHAASSPANPEPGWWEPMIGPGAPIDTDRWFVFCINPLGSCWGSSGPASIDPETGEPYRLDFPDLTIEDVARASQLVVEHLGIERLAAVVGPSMGGMTAQAWLMQNPRGARHALFISTTPWAEPFTIAIRSLQREAIVCDRSFHHGGYDEDDWPECGMRIARKLGMISYRSPAEWRERFGRKGQEHFPEQRFGMHFAVESYLENAARKFARNFDPCSYLYLSNAMDLFDASGCHDCDLAAAYASIELETAQVVGVDSDMLFPLRQQQDIARALNQSGVPTAFTTLPSVQGHDAFLVDYARFNPVVERYFGRIAQDRSDAASA